MSQNSKFKLKYDELRASDPTENENKRETASSDPKTSANNSRARVQNICFAWPNGRKKFFNYAYLTSGELTLENETNIIALSFTSDIVIIKGYKLEKLFMQLRNHQTTDITQLDRRYVMGSESESAVIEIIVTPLK